MPRRAVTELIELCHRHEVTVSTGGFIERVLTQGAGAVDRYIRECRELGFDIIEISSGFITAAGRRLAATRGGVRKAGLKAKPEVGIQFGREARRAPRQLEQQGTRDAEWAIRAGAAFP